MLRLAMSELETLTAELIVAARQSIAGKVAVTPVLTSATAGLRAADPNLVDLFRLHGASSWQRLWRLEFPSALPQLLSGLKVSASLALIGAQLLGMEHGGPPRRLRS